MDEMMSAMRAAIYARKSTDQIGVQDAERSVTRQVDHARAYARGQGWTVADEHTFSDDGISGAEFANRPGFLRLMNALRPKAPFDVLIVSELSRLGREQLETGYALKQLSQAGVKIYSYSEAREVRLDTPIDKFLMSAVNFAAEIEREKASQRTYDAMRRKALAGHVTGGRVFGYDNVRTEAGPTIRVINATEAAVVRRMFELYTEGYGQSRIAKMLNEERAVAPRSQQGRPRAWAPSSVHEVLGRPLYRGRIVWNRTRKRDQWGQHRQHPKPEADWLEVEASALRIVPESLWTAVQGRRDQRRAQYLKATGGKTFGRPRRDVDSKYLLPGFARCATCGGGMCVRSRSHGGHRAHLYGCTSYWQRGRTVCPNNLEVRMADADEAVLSAVAGVVLAPDIVDEVVAGVLASLQLEHSGHARRTRERELQTREAEIERLVNAIETGGNLESLLERLKQRQTERDALAADLEQVAKPVRVEPRLLDRSVRTCLADWSGLLTRQTSHGRNFLRRVLTGPVSFKPLMNGAAKGYQFEGEASIGKLLSGVIGLPTSLASPTGHALMWKPKIQGKAQIAA